MSQQIRNLQRNAELEKTENRGREIPNPFREKQTMRARGAIGSSGIGGMNQERINFPQQRRSSQNGSNFSPLCGIFGPNLAELMVTTLRRPQMRHAPFLPPFVDNL